MNSEIRIPTVLGLGVLTAGLIVGIFMLTSNRFLNLGVKASPTVEPQNITIANLSDTSVSVYWQTGQPSSGFIKAGKDTSLGLTFKDERDLDVPQNHLFHFITLTNLSPDTIYFYKIVSGSTTYPLSNQLSFKTTSSKKTTSLKPIIGTVLEGNQQAVSEAIITTDIPGAQHLAAVTKAGGNFILPLSRILTQDLLETFKITDTAISATLTIFNHEKSSRIILKLPPPDEVLPPVILGQDIDLTSQTASPTASFSLYDLNRDGVINSLDLAILRSNTGKSSRLKQADFNQDGIVNQKDEDILSKFIPNNSPRSRSGPDR